MLNNSPEAGNTRLIPLMYGQPGMQQLRHPIIRLNNSHIQYLTDRGRGLTPEALSVLTGGQAFHIRSGQAILRLDMVSPAPGKPEWNFNRLLENPAFNLDYYRGRNYNRKKLLTVLHDAFAEFNFSEDSERAKGLFEQISSGKFSDDGEKSQVQREFFNLRVQTWQMISAMDTVINSSMTDSEKRYVLQEHGRFLWNIRRRITNYTLLMTKREASYEDVQVNESFLLRTQPLAFDEEGDNLDIYTRMALLNGRGLSSDFEVGSTVTEKLRRVVVDDERQKRDEYSKLKWIDLLHEQESIPDLLNSGVRLKTPRVAGLYNRLDNSARMLLTQMGAFIEIEGSVIALNLPNKPAEENGLDIVLREDPFRHGSIGSSNNRELIIWVIAEEVKADRANFMQLLDIAYAERLIMFLNHKTFPQNERRAIAMKRFHSYRSDAWRSISLLETVRDSNELSAGEKLYILGNLSIVESKIETAKEGMNKLEEQARTVKVLSTFGDKEYTERELNVASMSFT